MSDSDPVSHSYDMHPIGSLGITTYSGGARLKPVTIPAAGGGLIRDGDHPSRPRHSHRWTAREVGCYSAAGRLLLWAEV